MSDTSELAPASLEYGQQTPLTEEELAAARRGDLLPIPGGWQIVRAYRTTMEMGFTRADDMAVPAEAGVFPPPTKSGTLTIMQSDSIPMTYLLLQRGNDLCHVEVAETKTGLAKRWSGTVIGGGPTHSTALGRAGVGGPTAIIDTGETLVRAMYEDSMPFSEVNPTERMERTNDGAQAFLDEIVEQAA